jgi:trans-aconitate methyltransferase
MPADETRPNRVHRLLFGAISKTGPRVQARLLRHYFDLWHVRPDPWGVSTDPYERHKYTTTLEQVPDGSYRRILDVGCSEGNFTLLASAAFPQAETVGGDISTRALSRARGEAVRTGSTARFVRFDLLTDDPGGRFDLVFCGEVLYYLGQTETVADRLARTLEPGGHLVLTHSRPQARLLHTYFDAHPELASVSEVDGEYDGRFYSVSVYTRTAA